MVITPPRDTNVGLTGISINRMLPTNEDHIEMNASRLRRRPSFAALKIRFKRYFLTHAPRAIVNKARILREKQLNLRRPTRASSEFAQVDQTSPLHLPMAQVHFNLRVGTILDEFSYIAWAPEFNLIPISPEVSDEDIASLDFLLVESAWNGNDGDFKSHLTGFNAPSVEVKRIVSMCKRRGIPTVFWNKEDPAHFEDFVDTARLFDIVATSDSALVESYRSTLGHDNVIVIPFAAQPAVHNPARNGVNHSGDVAFAGTYFRDKFPDRRSQMDDLLGGAHDAAESYGVDFTIFSRHAGGELRYQFPKKWTKYVKGSLPYTQMLSAYRSYKVFLNVNSVTDSPSMCARRVFELAASGTPVISAPSKALPKFFGPDEIPYARSRKEAEHLIRAFSGSDLLRRKTAHKALRRVLEEHTYEHRARSLLKAIGIDASPPPKPVVSIVCSTNRDADLDHLLKQVAQQNYKHFELVVLGHGLKLNHDIETRAQSLGIERIKVLSAPNSWTLGQCLNELIKNCSGDIVAKFDDDDYYLSNYLRDQVNTLVRMNADLVGKSSLYVYLPTHGVIARRWPNKEHTWQEFVAGSTLVGWKEVFVEIPFRNRNQGEDSEFLIDLAGKGYRVYSSDSFNHIYVRGNSHHTWDISESEILANAQVETYGLNLNHVEV